MYKHGITTIYNFHDKNIEMYVNVKPITKVITYMVL